METLHTIAQLRRVASDPLRASSTIGLVPTMGALHEGHEALLRTARSQCDVVVASVFVNPTQFAEPDDLAAYPRDLAADERLARGCGVDLVFAPDVDELYPPGYATWVEPAGAAIGLESLHRPGHFRGVATVCVKLFSIVRPTFAYFGRKDAQQVAVVKQVVRDLDLDVAIRVVETVRDKDGLAFSSRNRRLSPAERRAAAAIPAALATGDPARARADARAGGPRRGLRRVRRSRRADARARNAGRNDPPHRQRPRSPGGEREQPPAPPAAPATPAPESCACPSSAR